MWSSVKMRIVEEWKDKERSRKRTYKKKVKEEPKKGTLSVPGEIRGAQKPELADPGRERDQKALFGPSSQA